MRRLSFALSLILVLNSNLALCEIQPNAKMRQDFAVSPYSDFEWWVDPQTHLVNFRRCDLVDKTFWECQAPMLLRGIDSKDIPALLSYYSERLAQSGNSRMKQFIKVLSGSLGTVTAYIGAITAIGVLKVAVPSSVLAAMGRWPIRGVIHLVSLGVLGSLLYFTADSLRHLQRQREIFEILHIALERESQAPPILALKSQPLFDEFIVTFRRALYEFTHGGGPYEDSGNLILQ